MKEAIKLSKGEERQTDILAKRVMPLTDYNKVLEHDKLYFNTMKQLFDFSVRRTELLGQKAIGLIGKQKQMDKNIDLVVDWAEMQLKCLDLKAKLKIQEKLIEDKEMHYENVFYPQYLKEVKEMEKSFDEVLEVAQKTILDYEKEERNERLDVVMHRIAYELNWWGKTDKKDKKNDEFRLQVFKPLKRLQGALAKIREEIKQEEKYKI